MPRNLAPALVAAVVTVLSAPAATGLADDAPGKRSALRPKQLASNDPTRILIFGTIHSAQMIEAKVDLKILEPILSALARVRPDRVAVERLPGETIAAWERDSPNSDPMLRAFGADSVSVGKLARSIIELDRAEALAEAESLLTRFETQESGEIKPQHRIRAACLLAAAYEPLSAALQWSLLSDADRASAGDMPTDLGLALTRLLSSRDESVVIGLALARRLGHQRVWGIDDQSDGPFQLERGEQLMKELKESPEYAKFENLAFLRELPARIGESVKNETLLDLYRWINSPAYAAQDLDAQWHLWYRTNLPSGLDRARAAHWESRNLAIAANIRRVTAFAPGKTCMVIIGAGHKPFLDAYLSQMMDVEVLDVRAALSKP